VSSPCPVVSVRRSHSAFRLLNTHVAFAVLTYTYFCLGRAFQRDKAVSASDEFGDARRLRLLFRVHIRKRSRRQIRRQVIAEILLSCETLASFICSARAA